MVSGFVMRSVEVLAVTSLFVPIRFIVKLSILESMAHGDVVSMIAFSNVRMLDCGLYITTPLTPGISERSLQLSEVTCLPAIRRS